MRPSWPGEWLFLYFSVGNIVRGLEQKIPGEIHSQVREFYTVTFCQFLVFALPGFLCRNDL